MKSAALPRLLRLPLLVMLTLFAMALHGFHPYAEDGGVYLPGIKRLLNPALYGAHPAFVLAPMRTSLFAPFVATLVRVTHIPLAWVILLLYGSSILLTLWASLRLAEFLSVAASARVAAVALLACWFTLPIAGTSLLLIDPYLTARSFSTPLVLLALGFALRRQWLRVLLALMLAAMMHPLMAGYGIAAIAAIWLCTGASARLQAVRAIALVIAALLLAGVISRFSPAESAGYQAVVVTRYYWFLSQWHWYEMLGLVAPLLLLLAFVQQGAEPARILTRAALLLGFIATLVALTFARSGMPTHLVARLQPLRALQLIYVVMILRLGAWTGEQLLRNHPSRWVATLAIAAAPLAYAARQTYPNSDHFEAPRITPRNPWQQAFLWVRDNTPPDALFAMDPFYITQGKHEDAQTFRAMAERDALPDYSKDGGEASIAPGLTEAWRLGVTAQTNIDVETDADRIRALRSQRPGWALLQTQSETAWRCPYANELVKICELPAWTQTRKP